MLAQFLQTHPTAYRKIIAERNFTDLLRVERDFPKKCRLWSDYFHQKFGAPEFTPDEVKADFATSLYRAHRPNVRAHQLGAEVLGDGERVGGSDARRAGLPLS